MQVIETAIPEVFIFEPQVFGDARGYFFESFRQNPFEEYYGKVNFVQDNQLKSSYGVLRGLRIQCALHAHIQEEVLDVVVGTRDGSSSYGQHVAVRLSDENQQQLWMPPGVAHGFVVLSETAIFSSSVIITMLLNTLQEFVRMIAV